MLSKQRRFASARRARNGVCPHIAEHAGRAGRNILCVKSGRDMPYPWFRQSPCIERLAARMRAWRREEVICTSWAKTARPCPARSKWCMPHIAGRTGRAMRSVLCVKQEADVPVSGFVNCPALRDRRRACGHGGARRVSVFSRWRRFTPARRARNGACPHIAGRAGRAVRSAICVKQEADMPVSGFVNCLALRD